MKTLEKSRFIVFMTICVVGFSLAMIDYSAIVNFMKVHFYVAPMAFIVVCLIGIVVSPFTAKTTKR